MTKVNLSPSMLRALRPLAQEEGLPLEAFLTALINEALAHRLREEKLNPFLRSQSPNSGIRQNVNEIKDLDENENLNEIKHLRK